MGGPPALGLGMGLTTPCHKKIKPVTKVNKKHRTWTDSHSSYRLNIENIIGNQYGKNMCKFEENLTTAGI
jgi:hypothetical protein